MIRPTQLILPFLTLGASAGLLAAAAWLRLLPTGQPEARVVTLLGCALLVTALWLLTHTYRITRTDALLAGAIFFSAAAAYAALRIMGVALALTQPTAPALVCAGLAALILLLRPIPRASRVSVALVLFAAAVPAARDLSALSGAPLARTAIAYATPDVPRHLNHLVFPLVLLGVMAGLTWSLLTRSCLTTGLMRGAIGGTSLAIAVWTGHVVACYATMITGQSPSAVALSVASSWALISVAAALALSAWRDPGASHLLRLAPTFAVALIAAYVASVAYGTSDYRLLNRLHADPAYTYIHLRSDGTRQRSIDQDANTARLWRCERFLEHYPRSAYRPAVMLIQAQCLFELWRFQDARDVLGRLRSDYPDLQGYPEVLDALAAVAGGAPQHYLRPLPSNGFLATWRRTRGALIAASAAESLALPSYDMFADYRRLFRLTGRRAPGKIAAELSGERLRPPCGVDHFG
jgi:hypothetical protein